MVLTMTKVSVESSLKRLWTMHLSRPLSDVNKYEVLDMVESLKHTAQDTNHEQQNFLPPGLPDDALQVGCAQ